MVPRRANLSHRDLGSVTGGGDTGSAGAHPNGKTKGRKIGEEGMECYRWGQYNKDAFLHLPQFQ